MATLDLSSKASNFNGKVHSIQLGHPDTLSRWLFEIPDRLFLYAEGYNILFLTRNGLRQILPLEKMQSKYHNIHSSILKVDSRNLEAIKMQVNSLKQNQKEERRELIDKINKWTDSEKKIARRIVNSIVTLTIYILLYARYDVETALFSSIL